MGLLQCVVMGGNGRVIRLSLIVGLPRSDVHVDVIDAGADDVGSSWMADGAVAGAGGEDIWTTCSPNN